MSRKGKKIKGSRGDGGRSITTDQKPTGQKELRLPVFFERNGRIIKFIGPYLLYIALFTGIYILFQEKFMFLSTFTAGALSVMMSLFGIESYSYGQSVYMEGFSVMVIDECTGMYELLVYAGCVLAFPTTLYKKLIGIVLGIPALLVINMGRLVFLSFIGILYPALFSYAHYYLWQVTFIFLIVLLMLMWIEKVVKNGNF